MGYMQIEGEPRPLAVLSPVSTRPPAPRCTTAERDALDVDLAVMAEPEFATTRHLQYLRRDIFSNLRTVARLSANGVEAREYIICKTDDQFLMDRAVYNLSVWKRRYRDEIARFRMRAGPRLPGAVEAPAYRRAA